MKINIRYTTIAILSIIIFSAAILLTINFLDKYEDSINKGQNKSVQSIQPYSDSPINVTNNHVVMQKIRVMENNWEGVTLLFSNYNAPDRIVDILIEDESSGEKIIQTNFLSSEINNQTPQKVFHFNQIKDSKGKNYNITISSNSKELSDNSVVTWYSNYNAYSQGDLYINGEKKAYDLTMSLIYSSPVLPKVKILIITAIVILLMLVVSVFLFFKKWPIHKLFVVFSLISGIVFAVILPPSTDEWAHFNRAYSISEGNIVLPSKGDTTGSYIPSSLRDLNAYYKDLYSWQKGLEEELNQNDKVFVAFPNSGVYSPVPYLSQSIGILFGRFLDLSPLIVFIISRIMNLVSWAVLLYFAIKRIPYGKSLIFGLALLPISIETAASCSADALLFASSFLLIAEILNIYHNPIKRIEKDNIKLLAVIICIIALCKPGFCLLALLLFVIPSQYYGSGKKYVYTNTLILASGGILTLLWTLLVGKSSDALAVWMQNIYGPGIDSKEQLINVLRDPTVFVKATIHAIDGEKQLYYWQMFLKTWVTPYAPTLFMIIYSFVFILSLIFESDPIRDTISIRGKSIMVGVFLLISMAIYGIFYLTITPVGALGIKGTQGRYFIPLLPVLLLTVKSKWSISVKSSDVLLANLLFYISFFGVLYSMLSYYLIYK